MNEKQLGLVRVRARIDVIDEFDEIVALSDMGVLQELSGDHAHGLGNVDIRHVKP